MAGDSKHFIYDMANFDISATVTKRNTDEATSDVENWIEDTKNSLWGGKCITDNDCSIVSYCNNDVLCKYLNLMNLHIN